MCRERGDMSFTSRELRSAAERYNFSNPHDAVKIDNLSKLPETLRENDHCIVHLGKGRHQFIRGVTAGFHRFERIPSECAVERVYNPSLLNEINTSESNILSVGVNQRIFHEFLYRTPTPTRKCTAPTAPSAACPTRWPARPSGRIPCKWNLT